MSFSTGGEMIIDFEDYNGYVPSSPGKLESTLEGLIDTTKKNSEFIINEFNAIDE